MLNLDEEVANLARKTRPPEKGSLKIQNPKLVGRFIWFLLELNYCWLCGCRKKRRWTKEKILKFFKTSPLVLKNTLKEFYPQRTGERFLSLRRILLKIRKKKGFIAGRKLKRLLKVSFKAFRGLFLELFGKSKDDHLYTIKDLASLLKLSLPPVKRALKKPPRVPFVEKIIPGKKKKYRCYQLKKVLDLCPSLKKRYQLIQMKNFPLFFLRPLPQNLERGAWITFLRIIYFILSKKSPPQPKQLANLGSFNPYTLRTTKHHFYELRKRGLLNKNNIPQVKTVFQLFKLISNKEEEILFDKGQFKWPEKIPDVLKNFLLILYEKQGYFQPFFLLPEKQKRAVDRSENI